jgi:hypothetical protein
MTARCLAVRRQFNQFFFDRIDWECRGHQSVCHLAVGGTDPDTYGQAEAAGTLNELPTNHNPRFAPVIHPTLETGIQTLVAGACAWLARD